MGEISWKSIGSARPKCSPTQLIKTSKIMHNWLPVMQVKQCPNCTHPDETLDHLFHCSHPTLTGKREELLEQLCKKDLKMRIPCLVFDAVIQLLESYFTGVPITLENAPETIRQAVVSQLSIGLQFLPCGFALSKWLAAMEEYGCKHPECRAAHLIHTIRLDLTDQLWWTWNNLVHRTANLTDAATEDALAEQLLWFSRNYHDNLAPSDFHIARFTEQDITSMGLHTRKEKLCHLKIAQAAFTIERWKCPPGQ